MIRFLWSSWWINYSIPNHCNQYSVFFLNIHFLEFVNYWLNFKFQIWLHMIPAGESKYWNIEYWDRKTVWLLFYFQTNIEFSSFCNILIWIVVVLHLAVDVAVCLSLMTSTILEPPDHKLVYPNLTNYKLITRPSQLSLASLSPLFPLLGSWTTFGRKYFVSLGQNIKLKGGGCIFHHSNQVTNTYFH